MKTKIATALSLVGVLGAGSAAALVNTQILDSGPASADTTSILTPGAISLTVPTVPTVPPGTQASTSPTTSVASSSQPSTTAGTTVVTVPAVTPVASGFLTSYNLDPAGVVTVDVVDGVVSMVSTTPTPGWTVVAAENKTAENKVEVTFSDGVTLVEFEVVFVDGQLVPKVESSSTTTSTTIGNDNTSTTVDDDDDDADESDDHSGRGGDDDRDDDDRDDDDDDRDDGDRDDDRDDD